MSFRTIRRSLRIEKKTPRDKKMNRRELFIRDDLRIVLQSPFTDKAALYKLYQVTSEGGAPAVYNLRGFREMNPAVNYFKAFSQFFSGKSGFDTKEARVDKFHNKVYTEGGVFIFLGNANVLIRQGGNSQGLNFEVKMGDLLSALGDNLQVTVTSDGGQMYAVHFPELFEYEDEADTSAERTGVTLPSGRRVGPWSIHSKSARYDTKETGSYDGLGRKHGLWKIVDTNFTETARYVHGVQQDDDEE